MLASMKPRTILYSVVAAGAAVFAFYPKPVTAQTDTPNPALEEALQDVQKQQATIVDNQKQIDDKLAAVSDALRIARIYVSRGGAAK